ncbi:ring-cleaving dioxygenase [Marinococcus luteus]|uniref:ring-cleaving dioxygenase n=1 Tax=Marinococcus luteus TaxID=1122204 RepID=UPI002ACD1B43|nr:ring-cleaving dioxygenase [Marinococcus luteus]MDZ5783347.1 ring-cleaving dioxygenase [Marinococcus luteus]
MKKKTAGIHHITAIVENPKENISFYLEVLGLRLVKKTVNFDDPGTYHLYFGDSEGSPGTIMTFFPWNQARRGRTGSGQVDTTVFAVPLGSLAFWKERLTAFGVKVEQFGRYNEAYLRFQDPHGLHLELTERPPAGNSSSRVPEGYAIQGFAGAVLNSGAPHQTADLLGQVMGMKYVGQEGTYLRFKTEASVGNTIEVSTAPFPRGELGTGTVHHIAFRAQDDEDQLEWQQHMTSHGYATTEVKDRDYFKAIYFRERGGLLFEIATDPPGFTRDEPFDQLGQELKLPVWLEPRREQIEASLEPVHALE